MSAEKLMTLPERGITLADGWWALILWAGKDVENRGRGTAARLRGWRGPLLLTASKATNADDVLDTILAARSAVGTEVWKWSGPNPVRPETFKPYAGMAVGVVDLVDAGGPSLNAFSPWAVMDSDHLVLANARAIDPFPFSGARGVWTPRRCNGCGAEQGIEDAPVEWCCRRCKLVQAFKPSIEVRP